jgi:hypothetical protein
MNEKKLLESNGHRGLVYHKVVKSTLSIIGVSSLLLFSQGCGNSSSNPSTSNTGNVAPTVNAGADKTVQINTAVSITGTATDSDGTISSYEWKKGSNVVGTTATVSYRPTVVGTDTLTLEVTDDDGAKSTDSMIVTVTALPKTLPTTKGLQSHFNFDGNISRASDSSENRSISKVGTVSYNPNGAIGQSLVFDGSNGYLDLGDVGLSVDGSLNNADFTLSYFVKTDTLARYSHFSHRAACSSGATAFDMIESAGNNNLGFALIANNTSPITVGTTVSTNVWILVTITKSAVSNGPDTYNIYKNGVLTDTKTTEHSNFGGDFHFSNSPCIGRAGIKRFKGELDDLRIYNRALSTSEILVLYNQL